MKKKLLAMILALALVAALAACGGKDAGSGDSESKELNIFMWSDYISDETIADFV